MNLDEFIESWNEIHYPQGVPFYFESNLPIIDRPGAISWRPSLWDKIKEFFGFPYLTPLKDVTPETFKVSIDVDDAKDWYGSNGTS